MRVKEVLEWVDLSWADVEKQEICPGKLYLLNQGHRNVEVTLGQDIQEHWTRLEAYRNRGALLQISADEVLVFDKAWSLSLENSLTEQGVEKVRSTDDPELDLIDEFAPPLKGMAQFRKVMLGQDLEFGDQTLELLSGLPAKHEFDIALMSKILPKRPDHGLQIVWALARMMKLDHYQTWVKLTLAWRYRDLGLNLMPRSLMSMPRFEMSQSVWKEFSRLPQLSSMLLRQLHPQVSPDVLEWIECCFESCDGRGHPRELRERDIPVAAQIIGVAQYLCEMELWVADVAEEIDKRVKLIISGSIGKWGFVVHDELKRVLEGL